MVFILLLCVMVMKLSKYNLHNLAISEARANVELTEAPNFDSEELKTTDFIDINTGKPRCIILLFYTTF